VREQLEHDRVIRLLQAKYKRKFEVAINPGNEQTAPVGPAESPWYPDLVLLASERTRKLVGVVEVETSESINHLEAMSQWKTFSSLNVQFHLYVPVSGVDSARRLCADHQIVTTEIWAYHAIGDQIRFTPVQRAPQAVDGKGTLGGRDTRTCAAGETSGRKTRCAFSRRGVPTTDGPSRCEVGGQIHRAFQAASRGCAYQEFGDIEAW
jgi:hypothetical protein